MSQELLCIGPAPCLSPILDVAVIAAQEDPFLDKELTSYFGDQAGELEAWAVVDRQERTTEKLFSEAQKELRFGEPFESTRLGQILKVICDESRLLILFYGSEYENLPSLNRDCDEFLDAIETQLSRGIGEIYMTRVLCW
ncbi:MAG: hypothetical protein ACOC9J_00135 [Persicimonas sp.]